MQSWERGTKKAMQMKIGEKTEVIGEVSPEHGLDRRERGLLRQGRCRSSCHRAIDRPLHEAPLFTFCHANKFARAPSCLPVIAKETKWPTVLEMITSNIKESRCNAHHSSNLLDHARRHFWLACYCACTIEFLVKSSCAGTIWSTHDLCLQHCPAGRTLSIRNNVFFCVLPAGRTCPKGRTLSKLSLKVIKDAQESEILWRQVIQCQKGKARRCTKSIGMHFNTFRTTTGLCHSDLKLWWQCSVEESSIAGHSPNYSSYRWIVWCVACWLRNIPFWSSSERFGQKLFNLAPPVTLRVITFSFAVASKKQEETKYQQSSQESDRKSSKNRMIASWWVRAGFGLYGVEREVKRGLGGRGRRILRARQGGWCGCLALGAEGVFEFRRTGGTSAVVCERRSRWREREKVREKGMKLLWGEQSWWQKWIRRSEEPQSNGNLGKLRSPSLTLSLSSIGNVWTQLIIKAAWVNVHNWPLFFFFFGWYGAWSIQLP